MKSVLGNFYRHLAKKILVTLSVSKLQSPWQYFFSFSCVHQFSSWFFSLKSGPIPASFCLFSFFSCYNFNTNWKKHRWCAWDSNPGPQDGRRRRNHRAMAATLKFSSWFTTGQQSSCSEDEKDIHSSNTSKKLETNRNLCHSDLHRISGFDNNTLIKVGSQPLWVLTRVSMLIMGHSKPLFCTVKNK